jgi:hypothetical protein
MPLKMFTLIFIFIMTTICSAWTVEWIPLQVQSNIQPPRSGHVAFSLGDKVYLFGGYAEESSENRYPTNDLWVFEDSKWTQLQKQDNSNKAQPQQRLASAAVTCQLRDGKFAGLVLGGWDSQEAGTGGVILHDLQVFTHDGDPTWAELAFDLEQPTSRLCAVTLPQNPQQVLVHNHRCTDHVLIVDLKGGKILKQPTSGLAPSPRGLHACVALPSVSTYKIILFGGAAQDGNMSNEVFVLDCDSWVWTKVEVDSKDQPSPRASPCMVALDEHTCLLYGGAARSMEGGLHGCSDMWLLEIENDKGRWTCIQKDGEKGSPPGRNAAQLTPLTSPPSQIAHDGDAKYFLLSGGWYPFRSTYDDNFILKVT